MSNSELRNTVVNVDYEARAYMAEKIISKQVFNGRLQYYIKWSGFGNNKTTHSLWEPAENIVCPKLVHDFEERQLKGNKGVEEKDNVSASSSSSAVKDEASAAEGTDVPEIKFPTVLKMRSGPQEWRLFRFMDFNHDLVPEEILGARYCNGELIFFMKWVGCDRVDVVLANIAHEKCPDLVIPFYESQIEIR